jgi:hypothetical protein
VWLTPITTAGSVCSRSKSLVHKERQAWEVTGPSRVIPIRVGLASNLVRKERQVRKGAARMGGPANRKSCAAALVGVPCSSVEIRVIRRVAPRILTRRYRVIRMGT